jgi:hypothetical protein
MKFIVVPKMTTESTAHRIWRIVTLIGAGLLALAIASYLDVLTRFRFEFIEYHFEAVGYIGLSGLVLLFVGCICRARYLDKQQCLRMAAVVFFSPWAIAFISYLVDGLNVHGSAALMFLIFPATLLALVLLLMARVVSKRTERST